MRHFNVDMTLVVHEKAGFQDATELYAGSHWQPTGTPKVDTIPDVVSAIFRLHQDYITFQ